VIINTTSVERLLQETRERIEHGVTDIVSSCKEMFNKARTGNEYALLRERFSRIKRRFLILKKIAAVYEEWLKIDFSKSIMRAYHALRKVNAIINSA
jgi:hypothetical protein